MAYGVYLAAVDPQEIAGLRAGVRSGLRLRAVIGMSHLVVHWTKEKALGEKLREIVDEGRGLGDEFCHPLRAPIVHNPEEVGSLEVGLRSVWEAIPAEAQAKHMFRNEVGEILNLLSSAAHDGSALVSVLEPPADEERASKVKCPFDPSATLPFPWGELLEMEKSRRSAKESGLT